MAATVLSDNNECRDFPRRLFRSVAAFSFVLLSVVLLSSCSQKRSVPTLRPFLAPIFSDNMVLQRQQSDPVWGWTTPGERVTVQIAGKTASGVADDDGKWVVTLPPLPVGGPYTLSATGSGKDQAVRSNVLVGDVWLCTGQSNMQFGVGLLKDAKQEVAAADYPKIRMMVVPYSFQLEPQALTQTSWRACTPETILQQHGTRGGFSAVGYFFGRALYRDLHVPIGLIQSARRDTNAAEWTSEDALRARMPEFKTQIETLDAERIIGAAGRQGSGHSLSSAPAPPVEADADLPSVLYNGMIRPLATYGVKGAIWYQGESNTDDPRQYRRLLPTLIGDWRAKWGQGDFPFLIVQLAGFQNSTLPDDPRWPELRDAQWRTAQTVKNVGIATAVDIGEPANIHPANKQEVGRRLALVARCQVYHEKVEDSGPVYQSMRVNSGMVILTFSHTGGKLGTRGGEPLTGFTIAGADHKWLPADARIAGETVVVSSPQAPSPIAVRYSWSAYSTSNLVNASGLPAFPFRTDDWDYLMGK